MPAARLLVASRRLFALRAAICAYGTAVSSEPTAAAALLLGAFKRLFLSLNSRNERRDVANSRREATNSRPQGKYPSQSGKEPPARQ